MSSNPLMMDYEGGDLLLVGAACGWLLGHCAGLCLHFAGCERWPKTAWRLSFSDEMRVRGVLYMRCAIQIDVFTFYPSSNLSKVTFHANITSGRLLSAGMPNYGRAITVWRFSLQKFWPLNFNLTLISCTVFVFKLNRYTSLCGGELLRL